MKRYHLLLTLTKALFVDFLMEVGCNPLPHVRLVNTDDQHRGQVQVLVSGHWGDIADDAFWSNTNAAVVCRELGFVTGHSYDNPYQSEDSSGLYDNIVLEKVSCNGDEKSVLDCKIDNYNYADYEDYSVPKTVAVTCNMNDHPLRLVGGDDKSSGFVEMYVEGQYGRMEPYSTVKIREATVMCREMGFAAASYATVRTSTENVTSVIYGLYCQGHERYTEECGTDYCQGWSKLRCEGHRHAWINCTNEADLMRIVGLNDNTSGRVELFHNGEWGSISLCNSHWGNYEASAACRMMGYERGTPGSFELGSGRIWFTNVSCRATERSLLWCDHIEWGSNPHNCTHAHDVGVSCIKKS